jgi:hypothetical protein
MTPSAHTPACASRSDCSELGGMKAFDDSGGNDVEGIAMGASDPL